MSKNKSLSVSGVILAAGKGTRMGADRPKVLLDVAGKPIVQWVIDALAQSGIHDCGLVISQEIEKFQDIIAKNPNLRVFLQHARQGTADAVAATACGFRGVSLPPYANGSLLQGKAIDSDYLLVCLGDAPAITSKTISGFLSQCMLANAEIGIVGMVHDHPTGYGRLVLDGQGRLIKIVEEKEADAETRKIKLCNSGVMMAKTSLLFELLAKVKPNNRQNEYYLTDCFGEAAKLGKKAFVYQSELYSEFDGINDREQLAKMESWLQEKRGARK